MLIFGIRLADFIKFLSERLIPGAITPPIYEFFFITSKVVAVPKSTIIKLPFLSFTAIAFAILSEPICFLLI